MQGRAELFFYEREMAKNPPEVFANPVLTAQVSEQIPDFPAYYFQLSDYQIQAESAISVEISPVRDFISNGVSAEGTEKTIFQKNPNKELPIASLTKLMTAVVAVEFYQKTEKIKISPRAVAQLDDTGFLRQGEVMGVDDLLRIMLIESSNDAAYALTELTGLEGFVGLMNLKARDLKMHDTYFYSADGLDPDDSGRPDDEINPVRKGEALNPVSDLSPSMTNPALSNGVNYSTAWDLVRMAKYLVTQHPKILASSSEKQYDLYLDNGFHHTLSNTNVLLYELNNVVGGKTGLTDKAGGCLLLVLRGKNPGTYYINVVLNSSDRFQDMRKLISLSL